MRNLHLHWRTLLICLQMPVLCLRGIARKAIGIKSLMKLHPFLQLLTLSLGDLDILLCLLEVQCQEMYQCFGHQQNVIVIADDIMIVGTKPSHSDHDQGLTTCLKLLGNVMCN